MGVYKSKHATQRTIPLSSLLGGIFLAANPESIPDNCLVRADNFEYGTPVSQLQTVPGLALLINFGSNVDTVFYDRLHSFYLASSGTSLYRTDLSTKTLIGTLTGASKPIYCFFGTSVIIASGGQLQQYDGSTLTTITGSPNSHAVAQRRGRVRAYNIASDVVNYSGVGDQTNWTNNPADTSSSQFYDVGYKDSSNLATIIELSTDLIALKTSGMAYRVESEADWTNMSIVEAAQKAYAYNQFSGISVGNHAYYVGADGFNSFATTLNYGSVSLDDPSPGYAINSAMIPNMGTSSQVWHVPTRKQIWVKCQNDLTVYIYHYILNAWTRRIFTNQINDVTTNGHDVYVACGTKIFHLDSSISTDDGQQIIQQFSTKVYVPQRFRVLVKQFVLDTYSFASGFGQISIPSDGSHIVVPLTFTSGGVDAYSDTRDAYSNTANAFNNTYSHVFKRRCASVKSADVGLTVTQGSIAIRNLSIDIVEV